MMQYNSIMKPVVVENVFSDRQLQIIYDTIGHELKTRRYVYHEQIGPYPHTNEEVKVFKTSGRLDVERIDFPQEIYDRITEVINQYSDVPLHSPPGSCVYAEYSGMHGTPGLNVHFDDGVSEMIVDFQLASNTVWGVGVDYDVYNIPDNAGILFNPVAQAHWRPIKDFTTEEFVGMLFFRCFRRNLDGFSIENIGGREHIDKIEQFRQSIRETR